MGALDLRKSCWTNGLSQGQGETRCRQSVARICLGLHASKGARWWRCLTAARSPRMPEPCLGMTDRAILVVDRFAACFADRRTPELIEHTVRALVGQRAIA